MPGGKRRKQNAPKLKNGRAATEIAAGKVSARSAARDNLGDRDVKFNFGTTFRVITFYNIVAIAFAEPSTSPALWP